MAVKLLERIQAKIELFRLEQRYTRRRHRRSTFVSNAIYVDGEYIYNTPNTTGSSGSTTDTTTSAAASPSPSHQSGVNSPSKPRGRLNRWSSMPGFGSMSKASSPAVSPAVEEEPHDWRAGRYSASYAR